MSPSLALVVNDIAVSEQRPVVLVEGGKFVERQIVDQDCGGIGWIVRAATQIDDLHAGDGLLQSYGAQSDLGSIEPSLHPKRKRRPRC